MQNSYINANPRNTGSYFSRTKIQARMLGFKFLALPMTFSLTLNKSLSLDIPTSKVIIFSLLLSHEEFLKDFLSKLKKKKNYLNHSRGLLLVNKSEIVSSSRKPLTKALRL